MLITPYQVVGLLLCNQLINISRNHKIKTKANKISYLEDKCQKTLLIEANSYKAVIFFLLFFWC